MAVLLNLLICHSLLGCYQQRIDKFGPTKRAEKFSCFTEQENS